MFGEFLLSAIPKCFNYVYNLFTGDNCDITKPINRNKNINDIIQYNTINPQPSKNIIQSVKPNSYKITNPVNNVNSCINNTNLPLNNNYNPILIYPDDNIKDILEERMQMRNAINNYFMLNSHPR